MLSPEIFSISCPTVIRFGAGVRADLGSFLPPDTKRIVLLRGKGGLPAKSIRSRLKQDGILITEVICDGEPTVASINSCVADLAGLEIDAFVACGGGAVMDSGKAIAFCAVHAIVLTDDFSEVEPALLAQPCPLPLIVLPTTAGTGAEVTSNAVLGIASKQAKISLRGRALFPSAALVDPELMCDAPDQVTLHAGLDAVTQIIEAFTSAAATPFSDALTEPNLERCLWALRGALEQGDQKAWSDMAWCSLASGLALANGGLGAAHGLASVIGGQYSAPHGALCGRFLIPVLRQNLACAPVGTEPHRRIDACCAAIAEVFPLLKDGDDLSGFDQWLESKGLARIADYGIEAASLDALADLGSAASSSQKNAVRLSKEDYVEILKAAL